MSKLENKSKVVKKKVTTTTVINVSKKELNKKGYLDFATWSANPDNVYIGRNMNFYVKGATASKWANPYSAKKYGRTECIEMYEKYLLDNEDLLAALSELKGKNLGCWCAPEACHGDVLKRLLDELIE